MRSELQLVQFPDMLMALRCEECWPSPKGCPAGLGAQFHIVASQLPCVGRKLRPQQAWVHSVGNRGCIYWPSSGPSEPPSPLSTGAALYARPGAEVVRASRPI